MTMHDKCAWLPDADGNWETQCGQLHILIDGTPQDNDMKYCCYCGGELYLPPSSDKKD